VDTAAALDRYTVEQIIGFARRGVFASFGLGAKGIAELRARFAAWPRT
jgi:hypothetical protein